MPTSRIVQTYTIPFKGVPEEWSMGFNFQMGENSPTDVALLKSISDSVWFDIVSKCVASQVKFQRATGGALGSDAVYAEKKPGTDAGVLSSIALHPETCVVWQSQNGPGRFVRKWVHTGAIGPLSPSNERPSGITTAMNDAWGKLNDASLPGGVQYCFPNGDLLVADFTPNTWLLNRQFRRRGKRPPTPSG